MARTGTEVEVTQLPSCDFCKIDEHKTVPAKYDGKTVLGPWAYMCGAHYSKFGLGLGTGVGQRLILVKKDTK
jgi:hypothetical protein